MEHVHKRWETEKASSYRLYKTRYHNCIYLLLLGKKKLQSYEISHE